MQLWHLNTRSGQRDWGATDSKAFFSTYGAGDVAAAAQDLQAPDIGWWPYNVFVAGSFYATTPDEVEFMAAQAAAWDGVQNLETDIGWLNANGRSADALQRSSNWHDLELPASIKERMRASRMVDYQLDLNASGWYIRTMHYHPPRVCGGSSCNWSLVPAFGSQSSIVQVRARALTALAADGSGQNLMLYGYGLNSVSSLGEPHSELNASLTFPAGKCVLKLKYSSVVASSEAMSSYTQLFASPLDLSGHTAIALTLLGDGSKATMVVRLEDSEGEFRNFFVDLNFTGWRNVTLDVPNARRLFDFPLIRSNTAMRYYRWSSIQSMAIAVTNAISAEVVITSIVARSEQPATLAGASVEVGGTTFSLPNGLQARPCAALACEWTGMGCFPTPSVGSCAEYSECSAQRCQSFDANGNAIHYYRDAPVRATAFTKDDSDMFAVRYATTGQSRARAEITLIEQSAELIGPLQIKRKSGTSDV